MDKSTQRLFREIRKAWNLLNIGDGEEGKIKLHHIIFGISYSKIKKQMPESEYPHLYSKRGLEKKRVKIMLNN